jgi:hypothetical protein
MLLSLHKPHENIAMKKRLSDEQIIRILFEALAEISAKDLL